jgi:hypothetical protein
MMALVQNRGSSKRAYFALTAKLHPACLSSRSCVATSMGRTMTKAIRSDKF